MATSCVRRVAGRLATAARRSAASVAYSGEEGSLSSLAARRLLQETRDAQLVGVPSIKAVFDAVVAGEVPYGVVPIENSASGSLRATYAHLISHPVVIGAELGVRERYCLCAPAGVGLGDIGRVLSHPTVLEACSGFLESCLAKADNLDLMATRTTTEATRLVASGDTSSFTSAAPAAAVATSLAARRHGLELLAEDIGNDRQLQTRYILIRSRGEEAARQPPFPHDLLLQGAAKKRSGAFALRNETGALSKLLANFAMRGIDIIKIESGPMHEGPALAGNAFLWDFLLFVDFAVPVGQTEADARRLWEALAEFSLWQCDFGTYPSHVPRDRKQQQSWNEMVDIMMK